MYVSEAELHRLIGDTLRLRRQQVGMTQADLARRVGLLRTSITNIEAGRQHAPIHVLYNICIQLDLEVTDVLPSNSKAVLRGMVEDDVERKMTSLSPMAAKVLNEILAQ